MKSVYYSELSELKQKHDYFETDGPVLLKTLPKDIKNVSEFSFIMKDEIVTLSLKQLNNMIGTGALDKNP